MDDDYVAQVLAKEARESSQKFSAEGLGAFLPRKPAGNAPKPNTRFLRHLIKETDNHNLALKRKEEREAQGRLRQLREQSAPGSTSTSRTSRHHRDRSTRDSERHRREDRGERHGSYRRRHRSRSSSSERERSRRHRRDDGNDRSKDQRKNRDREERRRDRHRHESFRAELRHRERSYSRSRSRSPRKERDSGRHRSERRSRRVESPAGAHSSRSHKDRTDRRSHRDENLPSREQRSSPRPTTSRRDHERFLSTVQERHEASDNESDPLEDLVGPLPPRANGENAAPVRSRGRGAYKPSASTIDAHFAPDYDPTLDVQPDDGEQSPSKKFARRPVAGLMTQEDDWDMALEALRDRAKWKQKGEERLRAAGMSEETISRWKGNAAFTGMDGQDNPENVRWSKKGEGREWDRGKVVDGDGHIDVKAAWR